MRSKLGIGILAGVLATVPYAAIVSFVTAPMMGGAPGSMPMDGAMAGGGPRPAQEPMILMVADLVGSDRIAVAWVLLLFAGAFMGALFAALFGGRPARGGTWLLRGALYGAAWWIAGGLVLMPVLLDMPAFSPVTSETMRAGAAVGLVAYLISGLVLGGVFAYFRGRARAAS